jgi:hypothetical protein
VLLLTSCASLGENESKSSEMEEVIFSGENKTPSENEIIFDDRELEENEGASSITGRNFQEIIKIASDNSKISTMFDRYGNKTETRHFNYHPRLSFVLLQTSAEGKRQVFVYGLNGSVKGLSEHMLDKVLTASADEIANSAGILQPQRQDSISVQKIHRQIIPRLNPCRVIIFLFKFNHPNL